MKGFTQNLVVLFLLFFLFTQTAYAQFIITAPDRVRTPLKIEMKRIGTISPRSTKEIVSSRLTAGCETLDRDHEIPKSQWNISVSNCTFKIQLYDSPVLIAEKSLLNI